MWMLQVSQAPDFIKVSKYYFLKGPLCIVGRSESCTIQFSNDRTISRKHAELRISDDRVTVIDCKTTFGTTLNSLKIECNTEVVVPENGILQFGISTTYCRVRKLKIRLCITRIDKAQKAKLRQMLTVIDGDIVQTVEAATHVVCTAIRATVKLLEALLLKKLIVTPDWIKSFADTSSAAVEIPPMEGFFPHVDDNVHLRTVADRSTLMSNLLVFLFTKSDEQYTSVITLCGGHVVSLCGVENDQEHAKTLINTFPERRAVAFVNGWQGPTSKMWTLAEALHLSLLSAAQVAQAVFSAEPPHTQTTQDFSQRVYSQHMSQMSQLNDLDEPSAITRTTTLVSSQPPVAVDVPRPPNPAAAALRSIIDNPSQPLNTPIRTEPRKIAAKKSSPVPEAPKPPVYSDSLAPITIEPQLSAISVASPAPPPTSSSSNARATEYMETRQENLIQALEKNASLRPSNTQSGNLVEMTSSTKRKSTKRKVIQVENIDTTDIDLSACADTNKRLRAATERLPIQSSAASDDLEVNETRNAVEATAADIPSVIYLRKAVPTADGWFESQLSQGDTVQRRLHLSQHTPENTYPEPNVVECGIRLDSYDARKAGPQVPRHANDKRRFRKNWVKVSLATHKISEDDMERVFPKETEREIQSRAEYEAQVREHRARDEMFTDLFR